MKGKKQAVGLLAALLLFTTAPAAQADSCAIEAERVSAVAGETVRVSIRLENNPGFTNYGIVLDYDREKLELLDLQPNTDLALLTAVNPAWTPDEGSGLDRKKSYGYVTAAGSDGVEADGLLFTASFRAKEAAAGEAQVKPVLCYLRDNRAQLPAFEERQAEIREGGVSITVPRPILLGDVDDDGSVKAEDAALAYTLYKENRADGRQLQAADVNGDGKLSAADAAIIYAYSQKSIHQFPIEDKGT